MAEKDIGKLHVEISGDSKNLKRAAKEGVESLKDVEKSVKSADSSSSFSKLKGSLDSVISLTQSTANIAKSAIGSVQGSFSGLINSMKNFGPDKILSQSINNFEKTANSLDLSQTELVLERALQSTRRLSREFNTASNELGAAKVYNKGSEAITNATNRVNMFGKQLGRSRTQVAILKDRIVELNAAGNLKTAELGMKRLGDSASKTSRRIDKGFKFNIKSMLRFSGILLGMRSIYGVLNRSIRSYIDGNAQLRATVDGASQSLGVALSPAIDAVVKGFVVLVRWIMTAVQYLMTFMNVVFGTKLAFGKTTKGAKDAAKAIKGVGKAAKDANNQVSGFDDLNIYSTQKDSGAGADTGAGTIDPVMIEIDTSGLGTFEKMIKKITDIIGKKLKPGLDIFKSI